MNSNLVEALPSLPIDYEKSHKWTDGWTNDKDLQFPLIENTCKLLRWYCMGFILEWLCCRVNVWLHFCTLFRVWFTCWNTMRPDEANHNFHKHKPIPRTASHTKGLKWIMSFHTLLKLTIPNIRLAFFWLVDFTWFTMEV